jgi:hypothetical protein
MVRAGDARGNRTGCVAAAACGRSQLEGFRTRTAEYLRANAEGLRPLDPELAAVIITRATEALVHGIGLSEPRWLDHPAFVDELTQLVVGYLSPRV